MFFSTKLIIVTIYYISICLFSFFINISFFNSSFWHKVVSSNKEIIEQYDYIIIGSGSAGSVVAKGLSKNPNLKILVLEAGANRNAFFDIPSIGILLQNSAFDWHYQTISQNTSCFALNNNASIWPLGKILGGTGMFNNLMYVRGHQKDFDECFKNKTNYNYEEDVLTYLKQIEQELPLTEAFTSKLSNMFLEAAKELKFDEFSIPNVNINNGKRFSSSHSLNWFESNVKLKLHATVEKILMKNGFEASSVKYWIDNQAYYSKAKKGIILAAGVINSPKILMQSGIGPEDHLTSLNIKTLINLPVGNNLQDHVTTGLDLVLINETLYGLEDMLSPFSPFEYYFRGSGPWTTVGCEAIGFLNTKSIDCVRRHEWCLKHLDLDVPNIQFMAMPLGVTEDNGIFLRHLMGISDNTYNNYFRLIKGKSISLLPVLLHPKSKGTVRLKSNKFEDSPLIDPNYLSEKEDVDLLIRSIYLIQDMIKTEALQKLEAELNPLKFPSCEQFKFNTFSYWKCYIRHLTITAYHPVGTCKMGHVDDSSTVVDYNYQVKFANKLFVVDASIMGNLPSGNINAAVLMFAKRAVDQINYVDFLNNAKSSIFDIFVNSNTCF